MHRVVRTRPAALFSSILFTVMAIVVVQLATAEGGPPHSRQVALTEAAPAQLGVRAAPPTAAKSASETTTSTTTPTTTPATTPATGAAPSAMVATPRAVAVAPAPAATNPGVVPPAGGATAWGCSAALAYLQAYAAKGFTLECPGYAEGQEAMTCLREAGACPTSAVIAIADPCPQAYMNEASNSYVILGVSDSRIDPYGACS